MPVSHCACPKCSYRYSVSDDIIGKAARCPKCRATLLVRAIGGKTTLQLAGVDSAAAMVAVSDSQGTAVVKAEKIAPAKKPVRVWPWLLAGGALLTMCCGGCGMGGVVLWWGWQPVRSTAKQEAAAKDQAAAKAADAPKPDAPKEDPEKEEFIHFVRMNAQNPEGLEILSWGEKQTHANGEKFRDVRFRCKLIGIRPNLAFQPGVKDSLAGSPVMLEDTRVVYTDEGKIKSMYIPHCGTIWRAK